MSRRHRRRIRERQDRVTVGMYQIVLAPVCQTKACRRYAKRLLTVIEPQVRQEADKMVGQWIENAIHGQCQSSIIGIDMGDPAGDVTVMTRCRQ